MPSRNRFRSFSSHGIYEVKICWYLRKTKGSCHILSMLVQGKTGEEAVETLKAELKKKAKHYRVDLRRPITAHEVKLLGYFMYPTIIKGKKK